MKLEHGKIYKSEKIGLVHVTSREERSDERNHFIDGSFNGHPVGSRNGPSYVFKENGEICLDFDGKDKPSGWDLTEEVAGFISIIPGSTPSLGGKIMLGDFEITLTDNGFVATRINSEYGVNTNDTFVIDSRTNGYVPFDVKK